MKKYHVLSVILSLILCLSLCFSMLPYTALAEEGSGGETAGETMPLSTEEESGSRTTPGEIPENEETGSEPGEAGGNSEKRAMNSEKQAVSPEKRAVSPEKRAVSPEKRAVNPEKRAVSPEKQPAKSLRTPTANQAKQAAERILKTSKTVRSKRRLLQRRSFSIWKPLRWMHWIPCNFWHRSIRKTVIKA